MYEEHSEYQMQIVDINRKRQTTKINSYTNLDQQYRDKQK